jgi:hypothetical protein
LLVGTEVGRKSVSMKPLRSIDLETFGAAGECRGFQAATKDDLDLLCLL